MRSPHEGSRGQGGRARPSAESRSCRRRSPSCTPPGTRFSCRRARASGAFLPDESYSEAGASVVHADQLASADAILMVGRPDAAQIGQAAVRPGGARHARSADRSRACRAAGRDGRDGDQPRPDPADAVPGPADGRAVVAGQHRRLQGGPAGGGRVRALLPAADHRRWHRPAGQGARARHRRGRPAGHRNRAGGSARSSAPTTSARRPGPRSSRWAARSSS